MKKHIYVGMDVDKEDNVIAVADGRRGGEVREYGRISNDLHALQKLVSKLRKAHPESELHFVYEADDGNVVRRQDLQQLPVHALKRGSWNAGSVQRQIVKCDGDLLGGLRRGSPGQRRQRRKDDGGQPTPPYAATATGPAHHPPECSGP